MSSHQTTTTPPTPSTGSESSDSLNDVSRYIPIVQNPDGSITRTGKLSDMITNIAADSDPNSTSSSVLTKDFPLNPHYHTWLRAFLPRKEPDSSSSSADAGGRPKLPLIVYFHGGGFIIGTAASPVMQMFCGDMAVQVGAMVVSVEYRLAPEHRLPAAYDDAMEALHWIRTSDHEWIRDLADISNCFLMGMSAGGNIAYHAGLRAAAAALDDLLPLKIRGLVLQQPYFGGSERTASELRLVTNQTLPLFVNDLMWELALPIGVDRDHRYSNPTVVDAESKSWEQMGVLGWKVMVTGCDGDPLIDRQKELADVLEEKGVKVTSWFVEGGFHGVDLMDPTKARVLLEMLQSLVYPIVAVAN